MAKFAIIAHRPIFHKALFLVLIISQTTLGVEENGDVSKNTENQETVPILQVRRHLDVKSRETGDSSPPAISFGHVDTITSGNNETSDDTDKNSVLNIITYGNKDSQVRKARHLHDKHGEAPERPHLLLPSHSDYLNIPKRANNTDKPQGRTLSTLADAFLSANCFVKQCRKNHRRAEFCCVRNFNQACCDYLGTSSSLNSFQSNFQRPSYNNYQSMFRPSQSFSGSSYYPDYNSNNQGSNYQDNNYYGNNDWNYNSNNYGSNNDWNYNSNNYGSNQIGWSGNYGNNYGGGYGWRDPPRQKPGMCPPANHRVRWPNLGWGKKWKDKGNSDFKDDKQEDYYLDEYDRSSTENLTPEESQDQEDILKLGKWDSTENGKMESPSTPREIYASIELSREDLIEAKKDRLLFGLLKNKKPPFLRPNIWQSSCSQDYHCSGSKKCCLLQVAQYHYKETCRQPTSQRYNSYWK